MGSNTNVQVQEAKDGIQESSESQSQQIENRYSFCSLTEFTPFFDRLCVSLLVA